MEHAMDKIAINRLVQFSEYIYQCPRTGEDWISNFNTFFTQNKIAEANFPECLDKCLERYRQGKNRQVLHCEKFEMIIYAFALKNFDHSV